MSKMTSGNNIETEYKELSSKNDWPALYQRIRAESLKESGSCSEAVKPQNKVLNRYRDVSPYDHSRIILQRGSSDYINANLIKVTRANRQYILTQGPLSNTVSHFWLMVWEQQSKAVLMLNKLIEKKQEKCYQYWPAKIGPDHMMKFTDVGLTLEYLEQQDHSYYLTRVLRLTDTESGDSRDILQFHYITWPDFGVPCSPTAFLEFLKKVRSAGVLEDTVGPAVVHCSAGIGRSGTFCLVDSCLVLIEKFGLNSVDVKEILLEMRKYRMGLIQTPEQLRFSYQAIIEGANQLLNQNSDVEENDKLIELSTNGDGGGMENHGLHDEEASSSSSDDDDDEPPPLPPPRMDSLSRALDRPLPIIPQSMSDHDLTYANSEEKNIPSGPLPFLPAGEEDGSSEDELEEEDDDSEDEGHIPSGKLPAVPSGEEDESSEGDLLEEGSGDEDNKAPLKPSVLLNSNSMEVRHRKRQERKEHMEAQLRDMKRRQQSNEHWTQLKRSLFLPFVIGGSLLLGGGLVAYFYFKN